MNKERLGEIIGIITKWPEKYNQMQWHSKCGTTHCIAGWCKVMDGVELTSGTALNMPGFAIPVEAFGRNYLALSKNEADW